MEVQHLLNVPISCFAFNKDRTQLAVSPNNTEVHVYHKSGAEWVVAHVLKEHDKLVTGLDWSPVTNRIVSCSQDRNAYVWTWEEKAKVWQPILVILRISRAATQVKWSPNGQKFAVSSGFRCISVCFFEEANNWWVSKHIRKPIRSTVLSIDWHPNSVLIACGCADFKARVFSGWIKGTDEKPEGTSWGSKMPFGELMGEFASNSSSGGWIHDAKFSPDGESLAFVGHDSTVGFVTGGGQPQIIATKGLPFRCLLWLTPKTVVAAGHTCEPFLFTLQGSSWVEGKSLDAVTEVKAAAGNSSFDKFRQMDTRGQEAASDTNLKTTHQNAIGGLVAAGGDRASVAAFVTAGVDGRLVTWTIKTLEQKIAGLKIT